MARLTVKALAELSNKPAQEQLKILHEQKYPKEGAQAFRIPYYRRSSNAIKKYYATDNDTSVIHRAIQACESLNSPHMRKHNVRVLKSFTQGVHSSRIIDIRSSTTMEHDFDGVKVRNHFDLAGSESESELLALFHFNALPMEPALATLTLEMLACLANEAGLSLPLASLEILDCAGDCSHKITKVKKSSAKKFKDSLQIIGSLWDLA